MEPPVAREAMFENRINRLSENCRRMKNDWAAPNRTDGFWQAVRLFLLRALVVELPAILPPVCSPHSSSLSASRRYPSAAQLFPHAVAQLCCRTLITTRLSSLRRRQWTAPSAVDSWRRAWTWASQRPSATPTTLPSTSVSSRSKSERLSLKVERLIAPQTSVVYRAG